MTYVTNNAAFQPVALADAEIVRLPRSGRIAIADRDPFLGQVVEQLEQLVRLPVGWDGYQAKPVGLRVAYFVLDMLAQGLRGPVAPHFVPGVNGDVQIEYAFGDRSVELHVRAPNNVEAWRGGPGLSDDGEEVHLSNDLTIVQTWLDNMSVRPVAYAATA